MPTPTCAAINILTSLAPSPIAKLVKFLSFFFIFGLKKLNKIIYMRDH